MKLFSYRDGRGERTGVMDTDLIHGFDIADLVEKSTGTEHPEFTSMLGIIESGQRVLNLIRDALNQAEQQSNDVERLVFSQLQVLAPLPRPVKMRCFSVYEKHMTQALDALVLAKGGRLLKVINKVLPIVRVPKAFYSMPFYYKGNPLSVIGHKQHVVWPSFQEEKMDYELELGLVIGKPGKDIPENAALEHVFGYTCFNDFSARDRLIYEMGKLKAGMLKAKDFDTGNAMGPWIVTADEIENPQDLAMRVYVNDELKGEANTSEMLWSIRQQIAKASEGETLLPGEFFGTGAAGNGCGIERWEFLNPGDSVTLEIDGVGTLTNQLVAS